MLSFFNKLFNIRTNEWPGVLFLFLMAFLTNTVAIWGTTIAYAAFLKQAGIGALPWGLVGSSVLSIAAVATYTAFADRITNDKMLIAVYTISALGIVGGLGLIRVRFSLPGYLLLYFFDLALSPVFGAHFTTYVNSLYDIQAAKRILPIVLGGFRVGATVSGLTMAFLTAWFASNTIILIWLLAYLGMIGLLWCKPYLLRDETSRGISSGHPSLPQGVHSKNRTPSYIDNMVEGFHYTLQSTYLRWIIIGTTLLVILMALLEYKAGEILLQFYRTPEELANFLALLVGIGNMIILPLLLFGISRLIIRLGVGNANLFFPVGNLLACGGLIVAPGLFSAAVAHFNRTVFRNLHLPIYGLLYNAVPLRMKGRTRAFVGGLIEPIGIFVGGGMLLLPNISSIWWLIPSLIGVLAIAYVVNALIIRNQYSKALIKMLEQEDYSFLLSQEVSDLTVTDPATLAWLRKKLEESTNHEFTVFMAQLISQVGGSEAFPILEQAVRAAPDARIRAAIIDVLVAADTNGDAVYQLYTDFLADSDGQVRQSAIAGLEQLAGPTDKQLLSKMLEMVEDPDISVRVRALIALAHSGNFYQFTPPIQVLDTLLVNNAPEIRTYGVQVLGQIGNDRAIQCLLNCLTDPADEVRLEAVVAVERLSHNMTSDQIALLVAEKVDNLLRDPIERVRQAALTILRYSATHTSNQLLVAALNDSSPQIRATAVNALIQMGKSTIPIVHPHLNSPNPQLRKMAAVILGRINPHEFRSLIGKYITENLLIIYRNYGYLHALSPCTGYQSIPILQSTLHEQNQRLVDEIFYLLAVVHDSSSVKIISESLRSEDSRICANAAEALESLTTPQITRLIIPLFEPVLPFAQLAVLSKDIWNMEQPTTIQTFQQLVTEHEDPWVRTLTIFGLGEISAVLNSKIKQSFTKPVANTDRRTDSLHDVNNGQAIANRSIARRRRKTSRSLRQTQDMPSATDLLNKLNDTGKESFLSKQEIPSKTVQFPLDIQTLFTLPEMETLVDICLTAGVTDEVQQVVNAARRMITLGDSRSSPKEKIMLSTIEKVIFLKKVPFFEGMTIEQLKVLANVCEEKFFPADTQIFNQNDSGGVLYVVVSGRVGIEQKKRKGSFVRVNTIEPRSFFGEVTLFDSGPHTAGAIAIQDTLTLQLCREPLIALARQYPELSLNLINVLSKQLRKAYDRTAELTRSRPRQLQKLFDQFE